MEHCIELTEGWQLQKDIQELQIASRGLIFNKDTFGSTQLVGCLQGIHRVVPLEGIEVVGLCTDICVMANAVLLRTAMPDIPITVDASCCAGSTPEAHKIALQAMKSLQIDVVE